MFIRNVNGTRCQLQGGKTSYEIKLLVIPELSLRWRQAKFWIWTITAMRLKRRFMVHKMFTKMAPSLLIVEELQKFSKYLCAVIESSNERNFNKINYIQKCDIFHNNPTSFESYKNSTSIKYICCIRWDLM